MIPATESNTATPQTPAHQDQLEKIEIQRRALEQLFAITRSVENLRVSLETTLLAGKATGHTSEKAIALYQKLNAKTHKLSDNEIHMRLKRVDQKIRQYLVEIIDLVEHLEDEIFVASLGDALGVTHNKIEDFKRSAQMMVALQVLLNVRGIPVAPKTFEVSQKVLFEKINSTKTRERQCRKQLISDTVKMEKEIHQLLGSNMCTEQMRPFLQNVVKGLKANREHIEQGLNINELPYEIDQITMTDCAAEVSFDEPNEQPAEKEAVLSERVASATKSKPSTAVESGKNTQQQRAKRKKKGVWSRLMSWADTPIDKPLKDIFKK